MLFSLSIEQESRGIFETKADFGCSFIEYDFDLLKGESLSLLLLLYLSLSSDSLYAETCSRFSALYSLAGVEMNLPFALGGGLSSVLFNYGIPLIDSEFTEASLSFNSSLFCLFISLSLSIDFAGLYWERELLPFLRNSRLTTVYTDSSLFSHLIGEP